MFESWFPQEMTTLRKLLWFRTAWEKAGPPPTPSDPLNTFVGSIVRFFSNRALPVVKLEAAFTPIQSGTGDPSPENIRPITGHTGCDIFVKAEYDPTAQPTVTVNFGQTVYGGTLTVNEDGSGQIVATMALEDLGALTWGKDPNRAGVFYAGVSTLEPRRELKCSMYENRNISVSTAYDKYISGWDSYGRGVFLRDTAYSDSTAAEFQTAMVGVQLCYDLATPITIPLTPGQIQTIVGENVVFVNGSTGNITVQAYGTEIS